MARRRGFSGAQALIMVDGKPIGWATGLQGEEIIQQQRIDVLGDPFTQEIESLGVAVTFTTAMVRILEEPLRSMGLWPENDAAAILDFPPLSLDVFDNVGGRVIFRIEGAKPERRSFQFDRGSVMTESLSWQAIKIEDVV